MALLGQQRLERPVRERPVERIQAGGTPAFHQVRFEVLQRVANKVLLVLRAEPWRQRRQKQAAMGTSKRTAYTNGATPLLERMSMPNHRTASSLLAAIAFAALAACTTPPQVGLMSDNEIDPYTQVSFDTERADLRGEVLPEIGVRKEVYDILNRELHDQPKKLEAALDFARRLQGVLEVDEGDELLTLERADEVTLAVGCLIESFGGRSAYRVLRQVESLTFDTAARVLAYQKFTKRLPRIFSKKLKVENPCDKLT